MTTRESSLQMDFLNSYITFSNTDVIDSMVGLSVCLSVAIETQLNKNKQAVSRMIERERKTRD